MSLDQVVEEIEERNGSVGARLPIDECPAVAGTQKVPRGEISVVDLPASFLSPEGSHGDCNLFGEVRRVRTRNPRNRLEKEDSLRLPDDAGRRKRRGERGPVPQDRFRLAGQGPSARGICGYLGHTVVCSVQPDDERDIAAGMVGSRHGVRRPGWKKWGQKLTKGARGGFAAGEKPPGACARRQPRQAPAEKAAWSYGLINVER
jgi:hypothetical protein